MIKKKDKGKTAWAVWVQHNRLIRGTITKVYEMIEDYCYAEIHEKCSDGMVNKYLIPTEDMFLKRKDAIAALMPRLVEYRDYYNNQIQFLSAELNKRGRKTLELPKLTFPKCYYRLHWHLGKIKIADRNKS